jgi:hypothetical protein
LTTSSQERIIKERKEKVKNMKIMYEVDDEVVMTRSKDGLLEGQIVRVVDTDYNTMYPYLVTDDDIDTWVEEDDIKPVTFSFLPQMNEKELIEHKDKMLEADNKKCLEFLAKNPSEYFSLEEIYKNANISFTSLDTLKRELVHQSEPPFWEREELGYDVSYKLKPNKKKYYGDDGSVLFRGKSEHYFCAVKKVKEVCDYNDEEESGEDE